MKSILTVIALGVFAAGLTGCIAQPQHDDLRTLYRKCQERVVELEQMLEERNAEIDALRGAAAGDPAAAARLAAAQDEIASLKAELAELAASMPQTDLSAPLVDALEKLAAQYPGLMTFDAKRKMVRLESDLTFALGSTKVQPQAADSLAKLARVLNSADAGAFEVRVVGHTDNVPITNPANKQKFETNWGLSAFRAISVMQVLKTNGVAETRMNISGYGEHQPLVANPARGGAQANRRVEIYLVPPYNPGGAPAPSAAATATQAPPPPPAETAPDENGAMFK